jgi:hypothetical protein
VEKRSESDRTSGIMVFQSVVGAMSDGQEEDWSSGAGQSATRGTSLLRQGPRLYVFACSDTKQELGPGMLTLWVLSLLLRRLRTAHTAR